MTATITRRPLAPVSPLAWQARAACRNAGPDLTEIDEDSHPAELAAARALCRGCEVVGECRAVALGVTDFAGVAGGMTELERAQVRESRGISVHPVSAADVYRTLALADRCETGDLAPTWVKGEHRGFMQGTTRRLPDEFVEEVGRLTVEGCRACDIADILAGSLPGVEVTAKTVAYARALIAGTKTRSTA